MNESHKLDEEFYEFALRHALGNIAQKEDEENANILDQYLDAPAIKVSKQCKKNMKLLIEKSQFSENDSADIFRWIKKYKVLPIAVVFIFVISFPFTANASIIDFFDWIFNFNNDYTSMEEIGRIENQCIVELIGKSQWEYFYFPQNIPAGFTLTDMDASVKKCHFVFHEDGGDSFFELRQFRLAHDDTPQEFSGLYDNKDVENRKAIEIDGYKGYWFQKNKTDVVVYDNNDYYFEFTFNGLSKTDIKKICMKLEKVSLIQ